ncbi:uncharacterized protein LOC124137975 [Haliotis rufescens]|uniref:uncharacterized protein LOC124137975 n=1 Tax=Haliotis rufescens TaxID=6454 RepID=UPI00201EAA07|nr:uncharacterized protein LOC124137975 [Haliotis rufescens]
MNLSAIRKLQEDFVLGGFYQTLKSLPGSSGIIDRLGISQLFLITKKLLKSPAGFEDLLNFFNRKDYDYPCHVRLELIRMFRGLAGQLKEKKTSTYNDRVMKRKQQKLKAMQSDLPSSSGTVASFFEGLSRTVNKVPNYVPCEDVSVLCHMCGC